MERDIKTSLVRMTDGDHYFLKNLAAVERTKIINLLSEAVSDLKNKRRKKSARALTALTQKGVVVRPE